MSELKHNIQQCVSDIHEWYDQNKLVTNKSKSSVMLATTRQRILHIDNNNLDVHIGLQACAKRLYRLSWCENR